MELDLTKPDCGAVKNMFQSLNKVDGKRISGKALRTWYYLWLIDELVQLCQFIQGEMSLDLLLVNHTGGKALFRHLAVIDLFLHRALGQKPVDVNGLLLSKPEINSVSDTC